MRDVAEEKDKEEKDKRNPEEEVTETEKPQEEAEQAGQEEAEKAGQEEAEQAEAKEAEPPQKGDKKEKKKKEKKQDAMKEKLDELEDRVKRQMAEFDNFRKRTEKEKSAMFETGARSVIEKILPVVDNFERGLASVPEEEKDGPIAQGMQMIYKQLITELENLDVKPIPAVGEEFNPEFHNAVMQTESDELASGMIAQELQKGYTYRDSVVRHSMVAVVQ